jgi:DNA adenine methylase
MYKVTAKNEMISPWDDKNVPKQICEADVLREISGLIKGVKFTANNFKNTISSVDENTFVFLDPPVVSTPNQRSDSIFHVPSYLYCPKPFTANDFGDLRGYLDAASDKGASVLLVLPYKKEEEQFLAEMFEGYRIKLVDYRKDNGDISYSELYITNY